MKNRDQNCGNIDIMIKDLVFFIHLFVRPFVIFCGTSVGVPKVFQETFKGVSCKFPACVRRSKNKRKVESREDKKDATMPLVPKLLVSNVWSV